MAKQDIEATEYNWDDGTYQTGATPNRKGQSAVITGLLIATIFLGGIASALGVINIHLLKKLVQQESPVLPVSVEATGVAGDFLRENPALAPSVPGSGRLQLQLGGKTEQLTQQQLLEHIARVTVRLTVTTAQEEEKTGTALILSADGYLLTNAHLSDSALSITAQLPDGREVPAALVACDPHSDLAVVYVQADGLTAATFSDEPTVTTGSIPAGDGLVFEDDGRVKGMLCLDLQTQQLQMVNPQLMMDIATQLVEKGCVSGRPCVGLRVQAMSNFCRQYWGLEHGVEITAAQVEGLLPGDILLNVNGQQLTTCHQLHRLLLDTQPGETVRLEIFRAGQRFTITIPVTTNP